MTATAPNIPAASDRAQRVEIVLGHIDALPTLSPVASRLLAVATGDDADLSEIIRLIESDPSLTGRMLALCRKAHLGFTAPITTVRKAVVMLGLEAVQSAVLSVLVFDVMNRAPGSDEAADQTHRFDRTGFWKHSIAVACCAELLADAQRNNSPDSVRPDEAFTAGLLHDLGKIVLHWIIPKSYAKVIDLAESRSCALAEAERTVLGIDHHIAGKRLAEHWGLPHSLQDVMWLHDQPREALPDVPHRDLISLVTAADALCRRLHLGWSGTTLSPAALSAIGENAGIDQAKLEAIQPKLHEALARRCTDLGLCEDPAPTLMLESIVAANERLARLNNNLTQRASASRRQSRALAALSAFFASSRGTQTVADALAATAGSLASLTAEPGRLFLATLFQARTGQPWRLARHAPDGAAPSPVELDPPRDADGRILDLVSLAESARSGSGGLGGPLGLASWLSEHLPATDESGQAPPDLRRLQLTCVDTGVGPVAILLHDQPLREVDCTGLEVLAGAWGSCLAAGAQTQGARRLGEALAQTSRVLAEAQDQRAQTQALARLGEVTAGAAHEMNTPLAVICGRSQMLAERLKGSKDKADAQEVVLAGQRLSDLITRLHQYATPPEPKLRDVVVIDLIKKALSVARGRQAQAPRITGDRLMMPTMLPDANFDPELFVGALSEILHNAMGATPDQPLEISASIDPVDDRLVIVVKDRGQGMSEHALAHAFDPFFSEKEAGRRVGLGLALARRFVNLNGGQINLQSVREKGTTVTVSFPRSRAAAQRLPAAAAPAASSTGVESSGAAPKSPRLAA